MNSIATRLRPAPPSLLGAGLLFWGWQTGFLVYAIPMALLLELSGLLRWRCAVTDREYNLISDISGLVFFILVVYIFSNDGAGGIYIILSIMPFILYPLILGQVYGERGTIRLSVLFISLRKLESDSALDINREINLSLPYFLLCIISASSGNHDPVLFFITLCLLFAVVLWSVRPRRYHTLLWGVLLALSLSLAYAGQIGMKQAQRSIEMMLMDVFEKYMWRYRDPDRASTAIGSLGRIKLSDRILLRVDTDEKLEKPLLLHEASYSNYGFGVWSNSESNFEQVDPDITAGSWTLNQPRGSSSLTVSTYMIKEIGVIPLPYGTTNIYDVNAFDINRNRHGTIRMETTTGWIEYKADYQPDAIQDISTERYDLHVPERHADTFNRLVDEWQLEGKPPGEIITIVQEKFSDNYHYSLETRQRYPRGNYLHNFLFENKEGHCEYFATSTVLLLRSAGIPARYAVGYTASEYSNLEDRYIVRGRDAHSWTLAHVDGSWRIVDTTPAVWIPQARENISFFEPVFDLVAWIKYRYSRWQTGDDLAEEEDGGLDYMLWLLPPLILILIWRLFHRRHKGGKESNMTTSSMEFQEWPGKDSAMYQLITRLEQQGYYRRPGETLAAWFHRMGADTGYKKFMKALELHYRYRFDPVRNDENSIRLHLDRIVDRILATGLPAIDQQLTEPAEVED